jgi:hypothetical protein
MLGLVRPDLFAVRFGILLTYRSTLVRRTWLEPFTAFELTKNVWTRLYAKNKFLQD